jgi:hypothetical protein
MYRYTTMYPHGQQGFPDDPVTSYVDALRASYTTPGSATARRAPPAPAHDFTRECFVCVAPSSSSSTDVGPAPHHKHLAPSVPRQARRGQVPARRGAGQPPPRTRGGAATQLATRPSASPGAGTTPWRERRAAGAPPRPHVLGPALRHLRLEPTHVMTTNASMRTLTSTAMARHSSGVHHRTWQLQPCFCAAAPR